jgi:hypothetical protein
MRDKFQNATFARYCGKAVVLLSYTEFGTYMVRFVGTDKVQEFYPESLTEF